MPVRQRIFVIILRKYEDDVVGAGVLEQAGLAHYFCASLLLLPKKPFVSSGLRTSVEENVKFAASCLTRIRDIEKSMVEHVGVLPPVCANIWGLVKDIQLPVGIVVRIPRV